MKSNHYLNLFSLPEKQIYVNNAAVGKIPNASIETMKSLLDYLAVYGEPPLEVLFEKSESMRRFAGALLGANPENIAFVSNTSDGLMIALNSIAWQPGDNVVVQADAFPASHYILEYSFPNLEKRYISVRDGIHFFTELEKAIDKNTRAVVVDYVNFLTGYRLDLTAFSQICRKYRVYSIVDGIQAAGACEVGIEAAQIDFFAAGGQKWLLSPMGTGLFYVRKEAIPELQTVHVGWLSAQWDNFSSFYPLKPLQPDARRFEYANTNLIGLYGLTESLRLLSDLGINKIDQMILEATRFISNELLARDMELISDWPQPHRSGMVTFRHPAIETSRLYQKLQANQVICSAREGYIRFSIHFYNSLNQMEAILNILDDAISSEK
jgi:selenocysteine lyase/cysteine desulfurase